MKNLLLILLLLPCLPVSGQVTTYFDNNGDKVGFLKEATTYSVYYRKSRDTTKAEVKIYFKSGKLKAEKHYSNYKEGKLDGEYKEYYENGQLHQDVDYNKGKINGHVLTYWENGKPKRIDSFSNDKFMQGECFNKAGKPIPHFKFEEMPEFPGGESALMSFLQKNIRYPKKARKANVQGEVHVRFIVDKNGKINDVEIARGVSQELNEESVKVVEKMPRWKPGKQDGDPVQVEYTLPIRYQLTDKGR